MGAKSRSGECDRDKSNMLNVKIATTTTVSTDFRIKDSAIETISFNKCVHLIQKGTFGATFCKEMKQKNVHDTYVG